MRLRKRNYRKFLFDGMFRKEKTAPRIYARMPDAEMDDIAERMKKWVGMAKEKGWIRDEKGLEKKVAGNGV